MIICTTPHQAKLLIETMLAQEVSIAMITPTYGRSWNIKSTTQDPFQFTATSEGEALNFLILNDASNFVRGVVSGRAFTVNLNTIYFNI